VNKTTWIQYVLVPFMQIVIFLVIRK